MREPTAFSVLRNRAAVAEELRRLLPKIEGFQRTKPIPFGLAAIDHCLPQGGLAGGALHEITPELGSPPAAFGFLAALLARATAARIRSPTRPLPKVVLVLPSYGLRVHGRPHGHGLNALGLDPCSLLLVETAHRKETLWALEEALRSRALGAVAGVIDKLDLKSSQRLQLAAADAAVPLFLLRPTEILETSAAATRWRIGVVPAARDRFGLMARARWRLMLERCRNGRVGEWIVEYDHVAHCFSLASALADPAFPCGASEKTFRHAG